jgi:hypothetical protein
MTRHCDDGWSHDNPRDNQCDTRYDTHHDPDYRCDGHCTDGHRGDHEPTPYVDTTCQICKIHGHLASDSWWRYEDKASTDDESDRKDKDKVTHISSYDVDTNWYTDTLATNYIT